MRLFALASLLLLLSSNSNELLFASAESSGLYPPGLQPLITKANVLLASGQFNEAAKIYSEAIGKLWPHSAQGLADSVLQSNRQQIISSTTSAPRRTTRSAATGMRSQTLTRYSSSRVGRLTVRCS